VLSDTASSGGRKVADQTAQDTWELASSGGVPVSVRSRDGESPTRTQAPSRRKKKHFAASRPRRCNDKVCTKRNLWQAWLRVKANNGAPGCDGVTVELFNANAQKFLKELRRQLRRTQPSSRKTYRPRPVRRKSIPKCGKGVRNLGIPCVRDRIVQQALKQVLEPIFEPKFSKHSHGFRPGKGCATACKTADWAVAHGYHWVVDLDLKDFFETVNHDLLIDAVNEEVADGSVLRLIRQILKSGIVLPTGEREPTERGTPQGGPVSPLLANIYLHRFDVAMLEQGYHPLRYADDCLLFAKSQREAEQALEAARQVLESEWKLTLHPTKTQVVSANSESSRTRALISWASATSVTETVSCSNSQSLRRSCGRSRSRSSGIVFGSIRRDSRSKRSRKRSI